MLNSRCLPALSLAAILLALVCLVRVEAAPVTLTDTLGREVTVKLPAQRVLLGMYFEEFTAVAGPEGFERVVAISRGAWRDWKFNQWQAYVKAIPGLETLADVGEVEQGSFSAEKVIASQPDVALLAAWQYDMLGEAIINLLTRAGIPVVILDYNAQTVEKHVASTLLIGKVMGTEGRARQLAEEYRLAVSEVQARVAKAKGPRPRVYLELGINGPVEYGNSFDTSMWGPVLELAGADNIAKGKVGKWGPLHPEYVLAKSPEVVFIAGGDWLGKDQAVVMGFGISPEETRARLDGYAKRPGWDKLPAVQNGHIYAVYHGGIRALHDYTQLQFIAKTLYPESFEDVDPLANLRRFYATYLPVTPEGSFMISWR